MKKYCLLFWLCLGMAINAFALNAPDLRCLEVDENGGITLHWLSPTDLSDFDRLEVHYSLDLNSNFSRITVIMNSGTTTYYDPYPDALNQSASYFVIAYNTNGVGYSSDTISTLTLNLSNFGNGTAQLSWNEPVTPMFPSYAGTYDIYKEYPANNWTLDGHTNALMYKDTIDVCDALFGYRVELSDASGCKNVSRPMRDRFNDMMPPAIPTFDSVSVDWNDDKIHLGWEPSTAPDAGAYIIYYFENNIWIPVDTVFGRYNSTWTDATHDPNTQIHHYRIAVMDTCLNASPMTEEQFNMQTSSQFDMCTQEAYISWTPYEHLPENIHHFNIYYSVDNSDWTLAGTANATASSYTFQNLENNKHYCFIVQAVNPFGTASASSTKTCFTFAQADNHDFIYIRHVSVTNNDNDEIEIAVSTGPTIAFNKVHLYKSIDSGVTFQSLDYQFNNGTSEYVFKDKNVQVHKKIYFYKAVIENNCNMSTAESNIAHNILLKGSNSRYIDNLNWNEYGDWENGVMNYNVQRHNSIETQFNSIGVTNSGELAYADNVFDFPEGGDRFIYRIEATANPDSYGYNDQSLSNEIILYQEPIVYIANAFKPQASVTPVFKPSTSFVNLSDYSFYIYSREGNLIFSTHNPEEGWDGKINDGYLSCAVYVYKVQFSYGKDNYYEKTGTVTLVR